MNHNSLEETLGKELFILKIGDRYLEPCLFIVDSFSDNPKDKKELAWVLIFLLLWFEKGNLTFPTIKWEIWVDEILSERKKYFFSDNPSEEIKKPFLDIISYLKKEVYPFESIQNILIKNPSFISYNRDKTPLVWIDNEKYISFPKLEEQENSFTYSFLNFLQKPIYPFPFKEDKKEDFKKELKLYLGKYPLTEEQSSLLDKTLNNSFIILSGGPGTGKTTTILSLLRGLISLSPAPENLKIALCAPTGLASMRLKESLKVSQENPFFFEGKNIDEYLKIEPKILDSLLGLGYRNPPKYNKKNPLPYDILLVDESSMIDLIKLQYLLEAISWKGKLILIGDPYQLPPINIGSPFKDVEKLAQQGIFPFQKSLVHLSENFRFASEPFLQKIITLILEGKGKDFLSSIKDPPSIAHFKYQEEESPYKIIPTLYSNFWNKRESDLKEFNLIPLEKKANFYLGKKEISSEEEKEILLLPLKEVIILTSQNEGLWGSHNLNELLKEEHKKYLSEKNKRMGKFLMGIPLMVNRNRPDLKVVNGERGIIFYPEDDLNPYACFFKENKWVSFPLSDLKEDYSLSFCQTIHKSQGSEYEKVFVIIKQSSSLLSQELLYTALTRTKKDLILISEKEIILKCCSNSNLRDSLLYENLKNIKKEES